MTTKNEKECFICMGKFDINNGQYPYTFSPHRDEKDKSARCRIVAHKKCIVKYLDSSRSQNYDEIAKCSMCRGNVFTVEIDQQYLDELIINVTHQPKNSTIKSTCLNTRNGCGFTGTHYNLINHIKNCLYRDTTCSNFGCGTSLKNSEYNLHLTVCLYR